MSSFLLLQIENLPLQLQLKVLNREDRLGLGKILDVSIIHAYKC